MKFLILACLVLSAVAEPEPQHETVGFTKHLNGAVVPVDTTSVLQQKALHGAAHATAAVNGFKFPFYVRPAVMATPTVKAVEQVEERKVVPYTLEEKKVVPYTYPLTYGLQYPYTYGLHHPVTYGAHYPTYPTYGVHQLGKREAEAEADPAVLFPFYTYGLHHPVTYGPHYPTYGVHHLGKREAEAEADPAVLYTNHYGANPYTYGTYGYPYTYTGYTGYTHVTPVPDPRVVETTAAVPSVPKKVVTPVAYPYTTYGYPYTYTMPQAVAPKTVVQEVKKVVPAPVLKTIPQVYGHHLTYAGLPTVHHLSKREAEPEADPAVLYSTYGYPYTYTGYTGYPYTTHATYPYTYGGYYGRPYYG